MIVTHESPLEAPWMFYESKSAYVANASWEGWRKDPGTAPGWRTLRTISAESDDLAELQAWCATMRGEGATSWRIHATWPMDWPAGHRLHGKRENAFREGWQLPREQRPES